jgi:hypothetical protein
MDRTGVTIYTSEKVYNPSELATLPKKINASSDHNPVLFCNAVQSLEASRDEAVCTSVEGQRACQRVPGLYQGAESYGGRDVIEGYDGDSFTGGGESYTLSQGCCSEA